jgi:hypothetical protein
MLKFSLSNAPADIERAELRRGAIMRWPIEQCFEEGKSYLGMGSLRGPFLDRLASPHSVCVDLPPLHIGYTPAL